jgi:hypothetical protein
MMAEHENCIATIFHIDYRYPESIRLIENFIRNKVSSIFTNTVKTFLVTDRDISDRPSTFEEMFPYKIARPASELQEKQLHKFNGGQVKEKS